ncbi:ATP-dependent RNA helicase DBP5 [Gamsiella multidivaricata]|uniref:ATP-dependent RNA helicase DBP5 n=1 Tax=Gamsiella multidivaricata TaxID=101098 RepID=UPI00221E66FF|nr:ATP-dependent RNA helicase DBP5 [Gamsiella multidivaricata]KAG0355480.1 RNA helicase required for poly(A+) mRNA export [Gamsiella multidivaricata]KAI7832425.1 ATP-dependent RNA helicase DBP5 [Gamsiella multidivaricata]
MADQQLSKEDKSALHAIHSIHVLSQEPNSPLHSATTFEDLHLSKDLLKGIYNSGFARPSKIQAHSLPMLLKNPPEHLIAQAQSGTGKTAAFSLAILTRLNYSDPSTQAIILAPSRELARQIVEVMKRLAKFTSAVITQVVPESVYRKEPIEGHVLVGTPGRMTDMITRRIPGTEGGRHARTFINVSKVGMLILDEADCMLDAQGLGDQSLRIKKFLPNDIQLVFFSATWDEHVIKFADRFTSGSANHIRLQTYELTLEYVKQFFIDCDDEEDRFRVLIALYGIMTIAQSIIFVERRDVAERIARRMIASGHQVSFLHGGLIPEERDMVMDAFRMAQTKVLVTTNVLARGIDIERVNMVINYDLPKTRTGKSDPVTYLHRIGRTGRFGRLGISVNFVHNPSSFIALEDIQEYFHSRIARVPTELEQGDRMLNDDAEHARLERMERFFKLAMKE